jgi:cell division protein ZapA
MSNQSSVPVTVRIMGNDYRIACAEEHQDALIAAAEHLSDKMSEIRNNGKLLGVERIAVMAALNITHELLACRQECAELGDFTQQRLLDLLQKTETALSKTD